MISWRQAACSTASEQEGEPALFAQQLARAKQGEAEGLSWLYRRFLESVFGYIAARVPDRLIAEDLTSEVFVGLVERIGQIRARDEAQFAAWLFGVARRTVAAYYRQRASTPPVVSLTSTERAEQTGEEELPTSDPQADPVRWAQGRQEWHLVVQAINQLTEEQRQVLVARVIMEYDVATVSALIGKQPNAVKALRFRALRRLAALLEPSGIWPQARPQEQTSQQEEQP